jgi:hypothetical protein
MVYWKNNKVYFSLMRKFKLKQLLSNLYYPILSIYSFYPPKYNQEYKHHILENPIKFYFLLIQKIHRNLLILNQNNTPHFLLVLQFLFLHYYYLHPSFKFFLFLYLLILYCLAWYLRELFCDFFKGLLNSRKVILKYLIINIL